MAEILTSLEQFLTQTGVYRLIADNPNWWKTLAMIAISGVLVYLAIAKGFEPLLLLPIAIGMLLTNIPGANIFHADWFTKVHINYGQVLHEGGFLDMLY